MSFRKTLLGASLVASGLLGGFAGHAGGDFAAGAGFVPGQPTAKLELQRLQSQFHEANTLGDYELMLSLWGENAVFQNPSMTITGRTAIADFFASTPGWGKMASLSPSYKSTFDIHGNAAAFAFECVIVDTGGHDPVTTALSTIPFGSQNPDVEIVQHSNATCTAIMERGRWVFASFTGGAGALQP